MSEEYGTAADMTADIAHEVSVDTVSDISMESDCEIPEDIAEDTAAEATEAENMEKDDIPTDIPEDVNTDNENEFSRIGNDTTNDIPEDIAEDYEEVLEEDAAEIMRDVLEENVSIQKLPSDQRGEWDNPDAQGHSDFILKDDAELRIYNNSDKSYTTYSGQEFKEHMMEEYGVDRVSYSHREPDFEPFEQGFSADDLSEFLREKYGDDMEKEIFAGYEGHVELEDMGTSRSGAEGTFSQANEIVAEAMGVEAKDIADYMDSRGLTWHECGDRHTVRAVPSEINQAFGHTGGIGLQQDIEALAYNVGETVEENDMSLVRESPTGMTEGLQDAIESAHSGNRERKQELSGK